MKTVQAPIQTSMACEEHVYTANLSEMPGKELTLI